VYIACSTLCFGNSTFENTLRTINDLRFHKVDLAIHEHGPHLKPSEVVLDVNRCAQYLRSTGAMYAAFHVIIDAPSPEQFNEQLRAVCRLARLLSVPVVTIPAAPIGSDLDAESLRLAHLTKLAAAEGVILSVETNRETVTAEPASALRLCEKTPGLGLTLDPSHYQVGPRTHADYDDLYPYVRHVRLRDTGLDKMQVRIGQGQIEYGKIVTLLERENYERALTVDIRDKPQVDYPIDAEVRKLKFLLESMV
jgi:sugar phosphate isomerase/epimerase